MTHVCQLDQSDFGESLVNNLSEVREIAQKCIQDSQKKQKQNYVKRAMANAFRIRERVSCTSPRLKVEKLTSLPVLTMDHIGWLRSLLMMQKFVQLTNRLRTHICDLGSSGIAQKRLEMSFGLRDKNTFCKPKQSKYRRGPFCLRGGICKERNRK